MIDDIHPVRSRRNRWFLALVGGALAMAACGGDDAASDLSPRALEGREIARESGCAACHGQDGQGGVGPAWVGLAGSTVELEDGSLVAADTAYLRRSIVDPQAEIAKGYTISMPVVDVTADEVDAIIAYIEELK